MDQHQQESHGINRISTDGISETLQHRCTGIAKCQEQYNILQNGGEIVKTVGNRVRHRDEKCERSICDLPTAILVVQLKENDPT